MVNQSVIIGLFALFVVASAMEIGPEFTVLAQDAHNYYNCPNPKKALTLLFDEPVSVEGKWFAVQSRTIQFPDGVINDKKITCINVRDLDANGNGGYPVLASGGINDYSATIHLYTQKGKGMHFRVQIYSA